MIKCIKSYNNLSKNLGLNKGIAKYTIIYIVNTVYVSTRTRKEYKGLIEKVIIVYEIIFMSKCLIFMMFIQEVYTVYSVGSCILYYFTK